MHNCNHLTRSSVLSFFSFLSYLKMIQDGTNIFNVFSFGASPELSTNMGESSISLSYGRCVPVKKNTTVPRISLLNMGLCFLQRGFLSKCNTILKVPYVSKNCLHILLGLGWRVRSLTSEVCLCQCYEDLVPSLCF